MILFRFLVMISSPYDIERIRILIDEWRDAGEYKIHWNGNDDFGNISYSGIYFIQYKTEEYSKTLKLVFMK